MWFLPALFWFPFRPISADSDALRSFFALMVRGFQPLRRRGASGGGALVLVQILCSELLCCWFRTDGEEVRTRVLVSVAVGNAGFMVISSGSVSAGCHAFVAYIVPNPNQILES
jgi:hypothetical protein